MAKKRNNKSQHRDPIPDDFGSWEAAADFWDTHDLTDYEDTEQDVPDVQIKFVQHHFRIDAKIARRIHKIAHQRGILPETLVNLWLAEKLRFTPSAKIVKASRNKKDRSRRVTSQV
jgi:hypothetical protein